MPRTPQQKQPYILIAEQALGKPLPERAVIHHLDGDHGNNAHNNLVICQDRAYHALLHQRLRAYRACGNPQWKRCAYCNEYDARSTLRHADGEGWASSYHQRCRTAYLHGRAKANAHTWRWRDTYRRLREEIRQERADSAWFRKKI